MMNDEMMMNECYCLQIPDTLKLAFLKVTSESKDCVLLHLLKTVIPRDQQTIVFTATRWEYCAWAAIIMKMLCY